MGISITLGKSLLTRLMALLVVSKMPKAKYSKDIIMRNVEKCEDNEHPNYLYASARDPFIVPRVYSVCHKAPKRIDMTKEKTTVHITPGYAASK